MTWHDIKVATLQKMVSAEGSTIPNDEATQEYVAAMPQAANEALQLLCTSNRFLRGSVEVEAQESQDGYDYFYDMSENPDFFEFGNIEVYEVLDSLIRSVSGITVRAGKYISFPKAGTYLVFYNAWPEAITENTSDKYTLPLTDDVAVLLPLYMASQLYKDDDVSIAAIYRNEFETARAELKNVQSGTRHDTFVSNSGW